MTLRARLLLVTLLTCACLLAASVALAGNALTVQERFTPDRLGVPTNLSVTGRFVSTTGSAPSPIVKFTVYTPAGMAIDARGAGTCAAAALEKRGPGGCPENSRAGFGGGVGVIELPNGPLREAYTLDFFFAPRQNGHLALLVYASAVAPVPVELVVIAREVPAVKPYGIGFSVEIPLVTALPGASYASVESVFATLGATNAAYYETLHGKRKLVHLKGIVTPRRCPRGGFPSKGIVDFADGTTLTVNPTIPCPHE
jgi:hypothetical protein